MASLQERDHALVAGRVLAAAAVTVLVLDRDLTLGPVEQHVLLRLGELPPRLGHVDVVGVGHRLQHPAEVLGAGGAPWTDGAFAHRQVRVGHHQLRIDLEGRPQAVALHAGAVRGVEREVPRRQLLVRLTAHRAGQVLAEGQRVGLDLTLGAVARHDLDLHHALGQLQRGLHGVGQAALDPLAAHESIHHDLDGVLLVAGQALAVLQELGDLDRVTVDPGPDEPLRRQVLQQRLVLALAPSHHRRQHLEPGPLGQLGQPVHDLLGALALQPDAVLRAVRVADAGPQEPQVVVDLGDGPHRRAWVAGRRLLVDGDGRRQPLDEVHVGLVHLARGTAGRRR